MKKPIYLALPYRHESPEVMAGRFYAANKVAAEIMRRGELVFSPISHAHPIAAAAEIPLPPGWSYWAEIDLALLHACGKLTVLMLDGWRTSDGVAAEIQRATQLGLPIEYLEPHEHDVCLK